MDELLRVTTASLSWISCSLITGIINGGRRVLGQVYCCGLLHPMIVLTAHSSGILCSYAFNHLLIIILVPVSKEGLLKGTVTPDFVGHFGISTGPTPAVLQNIYGPITNF